MTKTEAIKMYDLSPKLLETLSTAVGGRVVGPQAHLDALRDRWILDREVQGGYTVYFLSTLGREVARQLNA